MKKVRFRPLAWNDIEESAAYLASEAGVRTADQFVEAVAGMTKQLARLPKIGAPCRFRNPLLRGMRHIPISGFEKWLVFYRESNSDFVEVIRVLHGARDVTFILNANE